MKRYRFEAAIQPSRGWGAFVLFPHSTEHEFAIKGRVPVRALLDGLPYAGSLMPSASGYHHLAVPRDIGKQLGKGPGGLLRVELWKDDEPRTVDLPPPFLDLLRANKLLHRFEQLSITRRKEYRNWITSAKRDDTRQRRMERALEWLQAEPSKDKTGIALPEPEL